VRPSPALKAQVIAVVVAINKIPEKHTQWSSNVATGFHDVLEYFIAAAAADSSATSKDPSAQAAAAETAPTSGPHESDPADVAVVVQQVATAGQQDYMYQMGDQV
jgi:hypothetical protein